ncbi:MAG: hypothetical protein L0287_21155 [Anaerolineae bacterium]|nr:hypothetical protein [Anaerolineae bacterium]
MPVGQGKDKASADATTGAPLLRATREEIMDRSPKIFDGSEIEFQFEKSNLFRVIHVDGVFGGISPGSKLLHMAVYNERQPIPKVVTHRLDKGTVGQEILEKREGRHGLFREIEADLIISEETAVALRTWLDGKINEFQQMNEIIANRPTDKK